MGPTARALQLLGLALMLGGSVFLRFAVPPHLRGWVKEKVEIATPVGLGFVLAGTLGELGDLVVQLGFPLFSLAGGRLALAILLHSRVGGFLALRVLAASLAAALHFTPWFWPAAATLLLTFTLVGHGAMLPSGWREAGILAGALHLAGSAGWWGSALILRLSLRRAEDEESLVSFVSRFSRLGMVFFACFLPWGLFLAGMRLQNAEEWLFTRYGSLALLKVFLGFLLLLAAAGNLLWAKPRLTSRRQAAIVLRWLLTAELLLGFLSLTVAGSLVKTPPPGVQ